MHRRVEQLCRERLRSEALAMKRSAWIAVPMMALIVLIGRQNSLMPQDLSRFHLNGGGRRSTGIPRRDRITGFRHCRARISRSCSSSHIQVQVARQNETYRIAGNRLSYRGRVSLDYGACSGCDACLRGTPNAWG
jgi:hypothetical protein